MASPRMTDDEIWSFVTDAHTGIMTTLRRDGVPVTLPIWFACVDRRIYARTRGKKLERVRNDPRSSFLVEAGERWVDLRAVHLTGTADVIEADAELVARIEAELDRKYASFRAGPAVMPKATAEHYARTMNNMLRFTPDSRVLNWDNRKLSL